jgi:hypothetical protein
MVGAWTVGTSVDQPGAVELAEDRHDAAGAVHVLHVHVGLGGATLHSTGTLRRDSGRCRPW